MKQQAAAAPERLLVLLTITDRDRGESFADLYRELDLNFNMISPCYGAAGLEILDYFGLTETERDMVITIGPEDRVRNALQRARTRFHLEEPGSGIALTLPVTGVSGPRAYAYVTTVLQRREPHGR